MISSEVMRPIVKHAFRIATSMLAKQTPTLIRMQYKSRLLAAMKLAEVDRKQLAVGIGVSVQAVGQVLTGTTRALTAENSAKAARFLKVDAHWLATGEGEARPPMMQERAALSADAVAHAAAYDQLMPDEKQLWRAMVDAATALSAHAIPRPQPTPTKRRKH
jgi:transcriptional regulator with XRE-family HTH domain